MRILNDPKDIPKGILDRRHFDFPTYILNIFVLCSPEFEQSLKRSLRACDAPIGNHSICLASLTRWNVS